MKSRVGLVVAGFLVALGVFAQPMAWAQDADAEKVEKAVTEAELAHILVQQLGLTRLLPASPTDFECFQMLAANGIVPDKDGWSGTRVVTRASLARLIVLAMGQSDKVENKDDPQAWIDAAQGLGVSLDTVGIAADEVNTLDGVNIVRTNDAFITREPLRKIFLPVSEEDVMGVFAQISLPLIPERLDVTPN